MFLADLGQGRHGNVPVELTWAHHISTAELERRLGVDPIDTYLHTAGSSAGPAYIRRMDYAQRLPRRMLSSWVAYPRRARVVHRR
mgnify:CR=1 FL=1